jgi:hypothetical protein
MKRGGKIEFGFAGFFMTSRITRREVTRKPIAVFPAFAYYNLYVM